MAHRVSQAALAALVIATACLAATSKAHAQYYGAPGWTSPEPNYYAMPTGSDDLTAAMYPCPRPTPPLIGQTYITYGPLAPQDFMNLHFSYYATRADTGQVTRTTIMYGHHHNFHPSLTNMGPGLRTPAHVGCGM